MASAPDSLAFAHPATRSWFEQAFGAPTRVQREGWAPIVRGESTLMLAPTGSGKTLAAFLVALDRLMFGQAELGQGVRVLYVSPLKALGVDVERNLRAPLNGIRAVAERQGYAPQVPAVAVRTGDTERDERARLVRHPPDILITTPESLFLMLTSRARAILAGVETVIVDEIHSTVATKRGAHLFLTLERLERARDGEQPLQRVGLSATQRPLSEVARLLGGGVVPGPRPEAPVEPRAVTVVDASEPKRFDLRVEVPVEDMARLAEDVGLRSGDASRASPHAARAPSIWPSIHPRLVELVRAHRSTMIFVNSRRLAERLALALNELAEEEIALAHHGSISKEKRAAIEDRLKRGTLPAIIATSSLELGIDMGAVDLVVQIEAPLSVASGVQRIGRAGHHVGAVSRGVVFPKYRGDLLACAAVTRHVRDGRVEETFYPRNPLDVLAQQIVATVVAEPIHVDELYRLVRGAAPFAELPRRAFEGVLDMLSGRYPSDRFAELRPRITWDRITGQITARRGARLLAVTNAGTIPDRGLYGVFLAGEEKAVRVGELDEEMVFESQVGDVFLLGASSWRIEEITHDQVRVSPAPGEPGRMPFWRGDRPGRPIELGRAIGALARELTRVPRAEAEALLVERHDLDPGAARNLLDYLVDQMAQTGAVPSDRRVVIERFVDEVGDWVVAVLSPFGGRVHAPWAMAACVRIREQLGLDVDSLYSDDGIVFRLPEMEAPPDDEWFLPSGEDVEALVTRRLSETSLFAAAFRESAGRALLLPRRRPGKRTPLWVQRRKSADLLGVASDFPDFPIVLETYRECLRDVFDLPALADLLRDVTARRVHVTSVHTKRASPFAASLLFGYVANYLYEGDAPLAERRAHALTLDHAQLRELLGEPELRELLDLHAIEETELALQRLDGRSPVTHLDALHDLLLSLGDLTLDELSRRCGEPDDAPRFVARLMADRRITALKIGGEERFVAAEDAARYRDALGAVPPPGLPQALLDPVADPLGDLVARYARTHGPFREEDVARRFGLGVGPVRTALERLAAADRVLEGDFTPGRRGREWVDAHVLRLVKRRSLARLRRQVEPAAPAALGRFLPDWQGVGRRRRGVDGLLDAVEQLSGAVVPASDLERWVLPARVADFDPRDLDELCASGELVWRGVSPLGARDGRVALYLADHYALLSPPVVRAEGTLAGRIRDLLGDRGALFFRDLVEVTGALPQEVLEALWDLVWAGEVTNDTLAPLRSLRRRDETRGRPRRRTRGHRATLPGSEGRWSLLPREGAHPRTPTDKLAALASQLLERHGVLTREAVRAEGIAGGFSSVYPVLKAMEEAGRVRRGYFVAGLGATQFALPGADDRLRDHRTVTDDDTGVVLAATDPANPYGVALPWPEGEGARPQRAAGARVVLSAGELVGWVARGGAQVLTFLPETEPERGRAVRALVSALAAPEGADQRGVTVGSVDGVPASESTLGPHLATAGFTPTSKGLFRRVEASTRGAG